MIAPSISELIESVALNSLAMHVIDYKTQTDLRALFVNISQEDFA